MIQDCFYHPCRVAIWLGQMEKEKFLLVSLLLGFYYVIIWEGKELDGIFHVLS